MSESDSENTVLGKRGRERQEGDEKPDATMKDEVAEDESDDDVGPMPMPAGPGTGAVKKKRKGTYSHSELPSLSNCSPGSTPA